MHTEDEAKKLWCPMVRYTHLTKDHRKPAINRWFDEEETNLSPVFSRCIASGCAMWRWGPEPRDTRKTILVKKGTRERVSGGYSADVEFVLEDPNEPDPRVWHGFCGLAGRPE